MKGVSNNKTREELWVEQVIARDRRFLTSFTDEEFLEYECKRLNIDKEKLRKILVKYGYFRDNIPIKTKSLLDREFSAVKINLY